MTLFLTFLKYIDRPGYPHSLPYARAMHQRMLVDFADVLEVQHGKACELQRAVTQLRE